MLHWFFGKANPSLDGENPFNKLFRLFKELLLHSSGNITEALSWLTDLDKKYQLTEADYGVADFIRDLIDKGFIKENEQGFIHPNPSAKLEIALRRQALEDVFDQLKKSKKGNHTIPKSGFGDEFTSEIRPYEFGDRLDQLAMTESLKNAQIQHGLEDLNIQEEDLEVYETYFQSQTSTVLMIDVSHSMILYGEDRITPAKKVAMALAELITTRYPKDTLDIITFGDDATEIQMKDLPYLQAGPYHTNTVAGLEMAMGILRRRKNPNKQIMMVTDGKPTCIKQGKKYYKNPYGFDRKIINRTLALGLTCRKLNIPITTFMVARDPYLASFVDQFTKANNGKAFYSTLDKLGEFIFMDYKKSKKKRN
jgi:Ca-activated chloride channel homolog